MSHGPGTTDGHAMWAKDMLFLGVVTHYKSTLFAMASHTIAKR
jgi:hypothetical protein